MKKRWWEIFVKDVLLGFWKKKEVVGFFWKKGLSGVFLEKGVVGGREGDGSTYRGKELLDKPGSTMAHNTLFPSTDNVVKIPLKSPISFSLGGIWNMSTNYGNIRLMFSPMDWLYFYCYFKCCYGFLICLVSWKKAICGQVRVLPIFRFKPTK